MRAIGASNREVKRRIPYVLQLVGLENKENAYPGQLSGGEQQRVALARALVHSPQLIIADEPTGNIDPALSVEIMELLSAINSVGVTVVVVTHELSFASRVATRLAFLEKGEIIEIGSPEELINNPKMERTKAFMNKIYKN